MYIHIYFTRALFFGYNLQNCKKLRERERMYEECVSECLGENEYIKTRGFFVVQYVIVGSLRKFPSSVYRVQKCIGGASYRY